MLLLSLLGLTFFAVRLVTDPADWLTNGLGVAVCLFVVTRHTGILRSNQQIDTAGSLRDILDPAMLDEALESKRAILYKHSTRCPVSAVVINEVLRFAASHPDWSIYVLKVIERRALSDTVTERLGVPHASPQAFVIRQGRCVWHASHSGITEQQLSQQAE